MTTGAVPFSIDWILSKKDNTYGGRVDKIKNVIRVYEQANPFRYPNCYKDLSLVKYKLDKCYSGYRVEKARSVLPTDIPSPTRKTTALSKPPSPIHSSCSSCMSVDDNDRGHVGSEKSWEKKVIRKNFFMDDRITMTAIPSKSKGKSICLPQTYEIQLYKHTNPHRAVIKRLKILFFIIRYYVL